MITSAGRVLDSILRSSINGRTTRRGGYRYETRSFNPAKWVKYGALGTELSIHRLSSMPRLQRLRLFHRYRSDSVHGVALRLDLHEP